MSLDDTLNRVKTVLRQGRFTNEASVSTGAVLPILHDLGWPVFDNGYVWPEYSVGDGRVDFALLVPPSHQPKIFIEVKQVGRSDGVEDQLLRYAYSVGVKMAVVTTGQEWHFYLPGEEGPIQERRIYKLDILERELNECMGRLRRYLEFNCVRGDEHIRAAQTDHKDQRRLLEVARQIPEAWRRLMMEPDSILVDLLAETVEDLCGYKPNPDQVADFLTTQSGPSTTLSVTQQIAPKITRENEGVKHVKSRSREGSFGLSLHGTWIEQRNAREVLVTVFEKLSHLDGNFLERFSARRHGRRRRYVSKDQLELYPGRPDLCSYHSVRLSNGWWLGVNYSRRSIRDIIELACEVAGLAFGKDLVIYLGDS